MRGLLVLMPFLELSLPVTADARSRGHGRSSYAYRSHISHTGPPVPRDARSYQVRASQRGATANRTNADKFAANVLPVMREVQTRGVKTLQGIADALNRGVFVSDGTGLHINIMQNRTAGCRTEQQECVK